MMITCGPAPAGVRIIRRRHTQHRAHATRKNASPDHVERPLRRRTRPSSSTRFESTARCRRVDSGLREVMFGCRAAGRISLSERLPHKFAATSAAGPRTLRAWRRPRSCRRPERPEVTSTQGAWFYATPRRERTLDVMPFPPHLARALVGAQTQSLMICPHAPRALRASRGGPGTSREGPDGSAASRARRRSDPVPVGVERPPDMSRRAAQPAYDRPEAAVQGRCKCASIY